MCVALETQSVFQTLELKAALAMPRALYCWSALTEFWVALWTQAAAGAGQQRARRGRSPLSPGSGITTSALWPGLAGAWPSIAAIRSPLEWTLLCLPTLGRPKLFYFSCIVLLVHVVVDLGLSLW